MGLLSLICLIIITIFLPPVGVFVVAGCGADLLINVILTFLGYIPGHFHAFYIIFVYYYRKDQRKNGIPLAADAPMIFSSRVQNGGSAPYQHQPHHHYHHGQRY